jgi:hypothetical protein
MRAPATKRGGSIERWMSPNHPKRSNVTEASNWPAIRGATNVAAPSWGTRKMATPIKSAPNRPLLEDAARRSPRGWVESQWKQDFEHRPLAYSKSSVRTLTTTSTRSRQMPTTSTSMQMRHDGMTRDAAVAQTQRSVIPRWLVIAARTKCGRYRAGTSCLICIEVEVVGI